jgi:hypothetical protein
MTACRTPSGTDDSGTSVWFSVPTRARIVLASL